MGFVDAFCDKLLGFVPVERWIQAVGNVLKGLSMAFILIVVLIVLVIVGDWGFTVTQRLCLVGVFTVLAFAIVIVVVLLAVHREMPLFNPYERSLRRGRQYGTEAEPVHKADLDLEPRQTRGRELRPPPESRSKVLPPEGRSG